MASFSPTAEGFRVIFRRPSIPLAEVAWRWSFAVAAWFLGLTFLFEYAGTLPVNALDRLLLGTQQPVLVARAIHRIFEGSAFRFTKAGILLALALVTAWIILAALGRAVTVRSLIEELDLDTGERQTVGTPIRSLLGLNFFRAALTLAAIAASVGSLLLASSLWASTKASVGDITRLWFSVLLVTWIAWSGLNWLLSTSAIFVMIGEQGAVGVAVKADSQIGFAGYHFAGHDVRVQGTAILIDIAAIRRVMDKLGVHATQLENLRSNVAGGPVGAGAWGLDLPFSNHDPSRSPTT